MNHQLLQGFKNSVELTKWTHWLLYVLLFTFIAGMVSGWWESQLLNQIERDPLVVEQPQFMQALVDSDSRQSFFALAQLLMIIASGVLTLMWIYRANYNARQLSERAMEYTPGWSVGWYFIPFANLWKPYAVMKEIWQISFNPQHENSDKHPALLGWWWFFWIGTGVLNRVALNISAKAEDVETLMRANTFDQLSSISFIILTLLLLAIITKIHRQQMLVASTP